MSSELIFIIGLTVGVVVGVITISLFAIQWYNRFTYGDKGLKNRKRYLKRKVRKTKR